LAWDITFSETASATQNYFQKITVNSYFSAGAMSGDSPLIAELSREDADVTLFALAPNSIAYLGPVYDPFFTATEWTNYSGTIT